MKAKRILAGIVAAALVLTGVPVTTSSAAVATRQIKETSGDESNVITPILNVTAPVTGKSPEDVTAEGTAGYTIETAWYIWYRIADSYGNKLEDETFKDDTSYMVEASLTANDGYTFSASSPAVLTADGEALDAESEVSEDGLTMTVTYTFLGETDRLVSEKNKLYELIHSYAYLFLYPNTYTEVSYYNFVKVYEEANSEYTRSDSTADTVIEAYEALQEAVDGLVLKSNQLYLYGVTLNLPTAGEYTGSTKIMLTSDSGHHESLADYTDEPAALTERDGVTPAYTYYDGIFGFTGQWTDSATSGTKFDVYGDTQMVLRFMVKLDEEGTGNVQLLGKMDYQYGFQVDYDDSRIYMYARYEEGNWPEVGYTWSTEDFLTEWHEVVFVYTGSKIMLYVDGKAGEATEGRPNEGTDNAELLHYDSDYFTVGYNKVKADNGSESSFKPMSGELLADIRLYSGELGLTNDNYSKYGLITSLIEAEEPTANLTVTPYDSQTVWFDEEGNELAAGARFGGETVYTSVTTFTAHQGFAFAESCADNSSGALVIELSEDCKTMTVTMTYPATEKIDCTCELGDISVTSPITADMGTSGTATVSLSASAEISGDCLNHENAEAAYTYEVKSKTEGTEASIAGNELTVKNNTLTASQSASVVVTVTASVQAEDSVAEPVTAEITVNLTSTKADAEDIAQLQDAVNANLNSGDYSADTWAAYQDALENAQSVLANPDASVSEVEDALAALQEKQDALQPQEEDSAVTEAKENLNTELDAVKELLDGGSDGYTEASWEQLQEAYNEVLAALSESENLDTSALNALLEQLTVAHAELAEENSSTGDDSTGGDSTGDTVTGNDSAGNTTTGDSSTGTTTVPQKGETVSEGYFNYLVTGDDTVQVVSLTAKGKKQKTIKIFNTVSLRGKSFKVTSIAKNAFKGNKKLTTVTIGKNITSIGAKAFYGCKKLKKVTVKSKALKSVGKSAFKGVSSKITVKVPKANKKAYTKLFKKGGVKAGRIK